MSAPVALSAVLALGGMLIFGPTACTTSGRTSIDDYFRRLSQADDRFDEASTGAESEEYESVREFMLEVFIPLYGDYLADIRKLSPPPAFDTAHQELLDANTDMLALLEDSESRYASLRSDIELGEFFDEPVVAAANDRTIRACSALRQLAYENDIVVDLGC